MGNNVYNILTQGVHTINIWKCSLQTNDDDKNNQNNNGDISVDGNPTGLASFPLIEQFGSLLTGVSENDYDDGGKCLNVNCWSCLVCW